MAELGTSCPEPLPATKVKPLVVDLPSTASVAEIHTRLPAAARGLPGRLPGNYDRAHGRPLDSPAIAGADPAIVLVPGRGHVLLRQGQADRPGGRRVLRQRDQRDARRGVGVDLRADREAEKFRIEYWALEEAKLARMPKPKPLATRIALVTGAARASARRSRSGSPPRAPASSSPT
jgi:rhamnose utilization protein RhaD (predicted bifunctional aldolase and dehydrogenase)